MEEKKDYRKELFYEKKNGYDSMDAAAREAMEAYCEGYKAYLNDSRTEREAVANAIRLAEREGFVEYRAGMELKAGDKVWFNNRGKALMLAVAGKKPLSEGVVVAAAHVDAPRLDLKQTPLYEDNELAFFKTHYYGGIKKYQWTAIPLELHGVVATKDGEVIEVVIGREKDDPQFVISDLLPHLAADQMKKTLAEGVTGEGLNILIGSAPYADEGADRVKLAVMSILNSRYDITEEDFISAELCAVPAFDVRDIGLDRSLIGAYGHDDRVCAYAELKAIFDVKEPEQTCVCILADKEETGSDGVSGMKSEAFEWFVGDMCKVQGADLRDCFAHSICVSADVTAAFDPNYASVYEKHNAGYLNWGVSLCKYTGARGKSGASDASAEVVAYVRKVLDEAGVLWHLAELGKVDAGGGGTVAHFMANRNIDTLDAGTPVLAMHSPFEVTGKLDCYMTYKGMKAIFEA
ncbi:MAG: aminopeptidase [Firmicutes bacterium]|nr:aminopeptidase [Bacillota bacterium]